MPPWPHLALRLLDLVLQFRAPLGGKREMKTMITSRSRAL